MFQLMMDADDDIEDTPVNCLEDAFIKLSSNAKDFYLSNRVPERENGPESPLEFHREWVSSNRPVVYRNGIKDWPALQKWKHNQYFRDTIGNTQVTVSITPNGYADAAVSEAVDEFKFVMPDEDQMSVNQFLDIIENQNYNPGVHYIQKQNSNLTEEFSQLLEDTRELEWAREAFGKAPDAINFWLGDARAVTSTHKDPYENIYCVVRGYKDILLFPPSDLPWLRYRSCKQAKYSKTDQGSFEITDLPDFPEIPWIVVDPLKPDLMKYPEYKNSNPMSVRLNAGDVLYLPSLWFHHLQQSHGCVAVNFWYDMDYDCKWNYFQLLTSLCKLRDKI